MNPPTSCRPETPIHGTFPVRDGKIGFPHPSNFNWLSPFRAPPRSYAGLVFAIYGRKPTKPLILLFFISLLLGCGDDEVVVKPDPPATVINVLIRASNKVNRDRDNRPSPIVVRTYELKALGTFESAGFYNLFDNYESLLGADLVASEKFHLQPGKIKKFVRKLPREAKFVAVTAAYRDLNQAVWKDVLIVPRAKTTEVIVLVDELGISIWRK